MGLRGGEEQLGAMGEKPRGCGKVTWTKCAEAGQGTLPGCSSVPGGAAGLGHMSSWPSAAWVHYLPAYAVWPGFPLERGCLRLRRDLHVI